MGVEPKEKRGSMSESETKIGEYVVPEAALPAETEYEVLARMEREIAEQDLVSTAFIAAAKAGTLVFDFDGDR
jgi:hypothetical protein